MADPVIDRAKLLIVSDLTESDTVATLTFADKTTATLPKSEKEYDYFIKLVKRGYERKHPVMLTISKAKTVTDVGRSDSDIAVSLLDDDTNRRIKVMFQGHDGTYFLHRDHADFDKLHKLLTDSVANKKRLWFAARKPSLIIDDLMEYTDPKE